MRARDREAQARRRAQRSAQEAAEACAQNREAQARSRALQSAQEAAEVRARDLEAHVRRRAQLPAAVAAGLQEANTRRHLEVYWADWPVEYRNYARDITAAQRLFYAQARPAKGPPRFSPSLSRVLSL